MSGQPFQRRTLLRGLGGAAVATFAATVGFACGDDDDDSPAPGSNTPGSSTSTPGGGAPTGGATTLAPRTTITSKDGLLETTLVLEGKMIGEGAARRWAITVNGESPGPALVIRPGDRLRIVLDNRLAHSTNLHTHGLRVSPAGNADNPFLEIKAGEKFTYEIDVPKDHPGGLSWYHPHLHHHVAEQLGAGFFGPIVILDDADAQSAIAEAVERHILLQDTAFPQDEAAAFSASNMAMMEGREYPSVLVSGQLAPVVEARVGRLERWRILNASPSRFYRLKLDGHEFAVVGRDGGRTGESELTDAVTIVPGERLELLVRFTKEGDVAFRTDQVSRGRMGMGGGGNPIVSPAANLATFRVGPGAASTGSLPSMSAPSLAKSSLTDSREVVLSMAGGGGAGMQFLIDGKQFDGNRTDIRVRFGAVEEWTVRNTSQMDHPFHLHIWSFQVLAQSSGTPPSGWKDVINVPAGGWVKLYIPFTHMPGRTVYHCHILDHEDMGMMGVIEVA